MPIDTGSIDGLLKLWPQGATAIGLCIVAIVLFKYVATPLMDRRDANRERDRVAAVAKAKAEQEARQAELDARVRITESQTQSTMQLAELAVSVKDAISQLRLMHDRCHAREAEAIKKATA